MKIQEYKSWSELHRIVIVRKISFRKIKKKKKKKRDTLIHVFRISRVAMRVHSRLVIRSSKIFQRNICSNRRGLFLVKSWIYLWTNGFAALNDTLSFNLGPFYLCPPTHERLHPRKGRAIFSRHPLGVSHSCLFRAISIRPRLQRREKTSAR